MVTLRSKFIVAIVASAALSGVAIAEESGLGKKKTVEELNPYTDCGIGSMFDNDTAAVISNVIWDLGTTAISSKLSSPTTCNKYSAQVAQFILDTYPSVAEDTAKGSGSHLAAMLEMAGCDASEHELITARVRQEFGSRLASENYASASATDKAGQLYSALAAGTAGQCNLG